MKNHPDRVQGDEAKQRATATFAEISAAYELLTSSSSADASHPSFATTTHTPSYPDTPSTSFGGQGFQYQFPFPFATSGFDPFGFGSHFHFSDPFDLFTRTFGGMDGTINAADSMTMGSFSSGMGMSPFGGFQSMFGSIPDDGFPAMPSSSVTYSFSSSSYRVNTGGSRSRMVSTSTKVKDGKAVTRREETIVNPDGTKTTTIDFTGDEEEDEKRLAIKDAKTVRIKRKSSDNNGHCSDSLESKNSKKDTFNTSTSQPKAKVPMVSPETKPQHPRRYKLISKEDMKDDQVEIHASSQQERRDIPHSSMSQHETYVIDLTNDEISNPSTQENAHNRTSKATAEAPSTLHSNELPSAGCKRNFCELMSRCFSCCFPARKRRRIDNEYSGQDDDDDA
jgi:curved DNA-binding protein CbpA